MIKLQISNRFTNVLEEQKNDILGILNALITKLYFNSAPFYLSDYNVYNQFLNGEKDNYEMKLLDPIAQSVPKVEWKQYFPDRYSHYESSTYQSPVLTQ